MNRNPYKVSSSTSLRIRPEPDAPCVMVRNVRGNSIDELTPRQAMAMADSLIKAARKTENKSVNLVAAGVTMRDLRKRGAVA